MKQRKDNDGNNKDDKHNNDDYQIYENIHGITRVFISRNCFRCEQLLIVLIKKDKTLAAFYVSNPVNMSVTIKNITLADKIV